MTGGFRVSMPTTTSSSAGTEVHDFRLALLVVTGAAVVACPQIWPGYGWITLAAALAFMLSLVHRNALNRLCLSAAYLSLVAGALAGVLSPALALVPPLALALLALRGSAALPMASVLLFAATPVYALIAFLAATTTDSIVLKLALPSLLFQLCMLLVARASWKVAVVSASGTLAAAALAVAAGTTALTAAVIAALPAVALAGFLIFRPRVPALWRCLATAAVVCVYAVVLFPAVRWAPTPLVVWIPESAESYEAQFFANYEAILSMIGLPAKRVTAVAEVHPGSVVLIPWATVGEQTKAFTDQLRKTPHAETLTVVVAGEHTNYGGVADALKASSGGVHLNSDLTVPPGNRDYLGQMRTSSLLQFPAKAIINRGASVRISAVSAVPILVAEGVFVEPDIGEPLWVGDYKLSADDSRGAFLIAAAHKDGPTWMVLGDNSLLINRQLLADANPLAHLLALSTLRPSFIALLCLLMFAVLTFLIARRSNGVHVPAALWVGFGTYGLATYLTWLTYPTVSVRNVDLEHPVSGFDERNFNGALVDLAPVIMKADALLAQYDKFVPIDRLGKSGRPEIHFGLVKAGTDLTQFDARLTNCWRIGQVSLENGVRIMDGQSCELGGRSETLIGARTGSAALLLNKSPQVVLVLDRYFLANAAGGSANTAFIRDLLERAYGDRER
jgi:hypothetical protein